jgi:ketosteroid isomerase-like protein
MGPSEPVEVASRFLTAFSAADFERMRELLADEVEVHAQRDGRSLHNFAAHLRRVDGGRITEWRMADAKPADSDAFWAA